MMAVSSDNESDYKEDDGDDFDNYIFQLRAEEDSARKIRGGDADDGGRGDKEGLNLKVLIIIIMIGHTSN